MSAAKRRGSSMSPVDELDVPDSARLNPQTCVLEE